MSSNRVVLVTGANRGIGFAIVETLALRSPSDQYLLGCRDISKGEAAIQELRKLSIKSPIDAIQIDVTSDESLRAAVRTVESRFGHLDVLVTMPVLPSLRCQISQTIDQHSAQCSTRTSHLSRSRCSCSCRCSADLRPALSSTFLRGGAHWRSRLRARCRRRCRFRTVSAKRR